MSGIKRRTRPVVSLTVFGEDFLIIGSSSRLVRFAGTKRPLRRRTGYTARFSGASVRDQQFSQALCLCSQRREK